jgi:protein HOOK3
LADATQELATLKTQAAVAAEESEKAQDKLRALVEDLQDRLVKRQDELIAVEEDLRTATTELDETKSKLAESEEKRARLADDYDLAKAKAQQLYKAEATAAAYKKKLEEMGMMNQQMTDLEGQAQNYLQQIMELEAEVKKSAALQRTVTDLEEKISRLEKEKSDNESSSKMSTTEIADLKSRLSSAENAKKMYEEELEELRAKHQHEVDSEVAEATSAVGGMSLSPAQSAEERERTMRLEVENRKLREQIENLQKQAASTAAAAATTSVAATAMTEAGKSTPATDVTPTAVAVPAADGTAEVDALKEELARVKQALAAKEKETAKISSDKDKLEAYTKRTLAKFQDKYLVALQECKAKLKEKQDKIDALENRSASERTAQKREERLLSSTVYELGLAIMQNRLKSGTSASG